MQIFNVYSSYVFDDNIKIRVSDLVFSFLLSLRLSDEVGF